MNTEELIENFTYLDDWEDKYKYLIELGHGLPSISDEQRIDKWKVDGCQSQVWIIPNKIGESIEFYGDSDAIIVKGIIQIVLIILKDKSVQEILEVDVEKIFDTIGLREHISSNRRNGMLSMIDKIKFYASLNIKE